MGVFLQPMTQGSSGLVVFSSLYIPFKVALPEEREMEVAPRLFTALAQT